MLKNIKKKLLFLQNLLLRMDLEMRYLKLIIIVLIKINLHVLQVNIVKIMKILLKIIKMQIIKK